MPRFASPNRQQDTFKLPGIHLNNRIANPNPNPANPDARKLDRSLDYRRQAQSLPPPRQNGYLVTTEAPPVAQDGLTYYHTETYGGPMKAENYSTSRQRSLPSRRPGPGAHDRHRQANSAPSRKNRAQAKGAPLPKLNTLVARSRGPGGETSHVVTTNFAGMSTRDQEASNQTTGKFASNWAQVRVENHIDINSSPDRNPKENGDGEDKSHDKPMSKKRQQAAAKGEHQQGSRQEFTFHASPQDQENVQPDSSRQRKDQRQAVSVNPTPSPVRKVTREDRPKQAIRFADEEPTRKQTGDNADSGINDDSSTPSTSSPFRRQDAGSRNRRKKPAWNNRVAAPPPQPSQPTVTSWRRYEAELTHSPTLTSSKQVYKAYTGKSKQQLRDGEINGDNTSLRGINRSASSRVSSAGEESREAGSGDSHLDSEGQGGDRKNEYILTRNEAKMYIHLQNVYGSEAFRQQRKEWFFKKLAETQAQELKLKAEEKRRRQQRREESKRRQQRQLSYVRQKFRKEQLHRFRTQYVTSRVLEYEKADREYYGLPADLEYDDEGDEDDSDGGYVTASPGSPAPKSKTPQDPNSSVGKKPSAKNNGQVSEKVAKGEEGKSSPTKQDANVVKNGAVSTGKENNKTQQNLKSDSTHKGLDSKSGNPVNHQTSGNVRDQKESKNHEASKPVLSDKSKQQDVKYTAPKDSTKDANKTNLGSQNSENGANAVGAEKEKNSQDDTDVNDLSSSSKETKSVHFAGGDNSTANANAPVRLDLSSKDKSQDSKHAKQSSVPNNTNTNEGADSKRSNQTKADTSSKENENARAAVSQKADKKEEQQKASHPPPVGNKKTAWSEGESSGTAAGSSSNEPTAKPAPQVEPTSHTSTSKPDVSPRSVNQSSQTSPKRRADQGRDKADNSNAGTNKRTTMTKDAKGGRYITTTKILNTSEPARSSEPKTKPAHSGENADLNGYPLKETPRSNSQQQTSNAKANPKTKQQAQQQSHGQGAADRKRKSVQPKSEADQKKLMEKKFGKMFEVNTGPSWDSRSKPPKMEGIDTVMVRVTDDKGELVVEEDGRTRLKKREVKDVVKEAKTQLAESDKRQGNSKTTPSQPSPYIDDIRPASADTLDFDDDDEDEEDVFERVRRKYNLQIDSDDEDDVNSRR